ncbi:MAG: OmpA family protein [Acidobacteria bacterium]|nr:OmpA family protein [Acidobacteriota bacterium]MCW5968573.1 OmpA family protein [Blastocatellales bacterium]
MIERRKNHLLLLAVALLAALSAACAPPTVKLKVSRDEVRAGDPVTVSWETKNAKTIELNGQSVEKIGAKTVTPDQTTNYEVVAKRGKKEARDSATVKVERVTAAAPRITLRAEPSAIEHGQNATLRWESENARTVNIPGLGEVQTSGSREVSPRVSTTYTATALGDGGTASASTRVTVTDPPVSEDGGRPREVPSDTGTVAGAAAEFARIMPKVFFDLDRSDLRASEQEKLRRAAEWLQQERNRSITFRIEGNCDPRGTAEYNLGLGDRRAAAVRDYLISLGVDASRMDVVSYGLEKATGSSEGSTAGPPSWAFDRRADLVYQRGGAPR